MAANVTLSLILEKIASKDKDFRYMATSDLANELAKESFRFDSVSTERQVARVVLAALEDLSGEISVLAVKCLGVLVNKLGEGQLQELVGTLADKLVGGKKEGERDVAALGLKTVTAELAAARAPGLVAALTPRLVQGLTAEHPDAVASSLDLLAELAAAHGRLIPDPAALKAALLPELDASRAGIRKRAIQTLASLAASLAPGQLANLCAALLGRLEANGLGPEVARTYVQAVAAVSKSVGWKFGRQLGRAVPLVVAHLRGAGEGDDELREHCLQALESFVLRSPQDARPHLPAVLPVALEYLRFDPNYADDGMDEDEGGGGEEEEEELSEDEYSDDEDKSWKVRRAAAKLIAGAVSHYPDLLTEIYPQVAPPLVGRFREREESVKADVFATFTELLHQVGVAARRSDGAAAALLRADVPSDVRALARQLRSRSAKTKAGAFRVLLELAAVAPDAVGARVGELVPGIQAALADRSASGSNLKIPALQFLTQTLATNEPAALAGAAPALAPAVFAAAGERYYKVSAEALRVCEQLVRVLRPDAAAPVAAPLAPLVRPMYDAVLARLSAQDQDQEVKESAIACMAAAVARLGDVLGGGDASQVLALLLERLRNEVTRLPAVRAFATIARSPLALDLSPVLAPAVAELTSFLRKANRQLRQASLGALDALIARDGSRVDPVVLQGVVEEAQALVGDADLAVAALALRLAVTVVGQQARAAGAVAEKVLPPAIALVRSPLLQGAALDALQRFFVALAALGPPAASTDALLAALAEAGCEGGEGGRAALCAAGLAVAAGQDQVNASVKSLLATLRAAGGPAPRRRYALLCLGELGRRADLTAFPDLPVALTAALGQEEVAEAASTALGGVAAGNLEAYLPLLLQQVQAQASSAQQGYQLLKALNEVIRSLGGGAEEAGGAAAAGGTGGRRGMTRQHQEAVLRLLLDNTEAEAEENRAVVAECLGNLALLEGGLVLPQLQAVLALASPHSRYAALAAARHACVERGHPVDALLAAALPDFLPKLGDPDRHVRRAALQLLSAAAHSKPALVADQLPGALPLLYEQARVNKDLIRTVDLGPFKHQIDEGLELRKAAFECVDVLLDRAWDRLDGAAVVGLLESGLKDHYDIKVVCHLILAKLAAIAPGQVTAALERLAEPLGATLTAKVKSDAVKQEVDRNEDMLRSCLRAVDALARLPGAAQVPAWRAFMEQTVGSPLLKDKYAAIRQERKEAEGGAFGRLGGAPGSGAYGDPDAMDVA